MLIYLNYFILCTSLTALLKLLLGKLLLGKLIIFVHGEIGVVEVAVGEISDRGS